MPLQEDQSHTLEGALITLFEIYLPGNATYSAEFSEGVPDYRFANGVNEFGQNFVWLGNEYMRLPVEASGFEMNGQGKLPRPGIKIANVDQWIGSIARANDDLINAKLVRRRTFAKYLDADNFINGNATASTDELPPDIFYVDKKIIENKFYIEWELCSACDLNGIKLPRRLIVAGTCMWSKLTDCPNVNTCDHTLSTATGCRSYTWPDNTLPFGGFPGAGYS